MDPYFGLQPNWSRFAIERCDDDLVVGRIRLLYRRNHRRIHHRTRFRTHGQVGRKIKESSQKEMGNFNQKILIRKLKQTGRVVCFLITSSLWPAPLLKDAV